MQAPALQRSSEMADVGSLLLSKRRLSVRTRPLYLITVCRHGNYIILETSIIALAK